MFLPLLLWRGAVQAPKFLGMTTPPGLECCAISSAPFLASPLTYPAAILLLKPPGDITGLLRVPEDGLGLDTPPWEVLTPIKLLLGDGPGEAVARW